LLTNAAFETDRISDGLSHQFDWLSKLRRLLGLPTPYQFRLAMRANPRNSLVEKGFYALA